MPLFHWKPATPGPFFPSPWANSKVYSGLNSCHFQYPAREIARLTALMSSPGSDGPFELSFAYSVRFSGPGSGIERLVVILHQDHQGAAQLRVRLELLRRNRVVVLG